MQASGSVVSERHTPALDGIRGWACFSVLIEHTVTGFLHDVPIRYVQVFAVRTENLFLSGVDLFFVLSGFLIGGILLDQKGQPAYFRRFWIRRVCRILPVAYLLLATYAVALSIQSTHPFRPFSTWLLADPAPPLWSYLVFAQNFFFASIPFGPRWTGITWSLAIEEQFYFLFPTVVYLLSKRNLVLTVVTGMIAAPVLRYFLEIHYGQWYGPYVLLPSRMDGLLAGVGIALIVRNPSALLVARRFRGVTDALALWMLFLILTNYHFGIWPSAINSPFPPLMQTAFALLWGVVVLRVFTGDGILNRIWVNPVLMKLGVISYGLYMYHQSINGVVHGLFFGTNPQIHSIAEFIASLFVIAAAICLAALSYRYYETPIRRFGQQYSKRLLLERTPPAPVLSPAE